jgi:hypothetical protein
VAFCVWLIYVVVCFSTLFLCCHTVSLYGYATLYFSHWSAHGHLGCFYFLTSMNNAAMNIYVHVFVWTVSFSWVCPWEWSCWVTWTLCLPFGELSNSSLQ